MCARVFVYVCMCMCVCVCVHVCVCVGGWASLVALKRQAALVKDSGPGVKAS